MYYTVYAFINRHFRTLTAVLVVASIALYVTAQLVTDLQTVLLQRGFYGLLAVILLVEVLRRLGPPDESPVQIFRGQDEATDTVLGFITSRSPNSADMVEYSTSTIRALLARLRAEGTTIRLLACHPDNAVSDYQRRAIESSLEICHQDFRGYTNITIRLYRAPAAFRGRQIRAGSDVLIVAGWYTYWFEDEQLALRGHDNAMVVARSATDAGKALALTFDDVFTKLWDDPTTVELTEYLASRQIPAGSDGG
jgi:hypothetical protein